MLSRLWQKNVKYWHNRIKSLFSEIDTVLKCVIEGCQRPCHVELTRARQLLEGKLRKVTLVLGWLNCAWAVGIDLYNHFQCLFKIEFNKLHRLLRI